MRTVLYILIVLAFFACQEGSPGGVVKVDSPKAEAVDTTKANKLSDYKAKSDKSPVEFVSSEFEKQEIGQVLKFTFKNTSNKTVDGIMWSYALTNNFGHNISKGEFGEEYGASQKIIKPNESITISKKVNSEGTGIKQAAVNSIHYTDGSTWEIK